MFGAWRNAFVGWILPFDPGANMPAQRSNYFKRYLYRNYRIYAAILIVLGGG